MSTITSGAMEMNWDPGQRLAEVHFIGAADATGEEAAPLVDALERWIGTDGEPFGLLGNGAGLRSLDAPYRQVWGTFLRQHREEVCVAFFNLGPAIRIAADLFRVGTGLRLKAFAKEDEARSWLRGMGIAA
ncbi:MAG: hypothetical protein AUI14_16935 [Actinobacteria bacterium 13_2_20CM_2_71_6]|nr:MAG: hypothetical protein AUI14_16935 [Actinobacteria bacterium 13_2_20CM_2_71_6]